MTHTLTQDLFGEIPQAISTIDITLQLPSGFRQDDDLETKIDAVKLKIKEYLAGGWAIFQLFSGGKDSSVQLALTLDAMKEFVYENGPDNCPDLAVIHSSTLLDNPVINAHTQEELSRIRSFATKHNLPVTVEVAYPSMSENYLVGIIGGRTIASVAQTSNRKCAMMMKVGPLKRLKQNILKRLNKKYGDKVVSLIAKRYDESDVRRADMLRWGEVPHHHIRRGSENILSSVSHFSLDDIYLYIGMVRSEQIQTYSCFTSLVECYRAANGGDCMVNALNGKVGSTFCGSRYGCWLCLQTQDDKSMETMLEDDNFDYMRYLWAFRNYLQAYHDDPSKRCWLARKVKADGTIQIAPNSYSPEFTEELLRMALSIQAYEEEMAARLEIAPRFTVISLEEVIACDVLWQRYGYHKGLQALQIWKEVVNEGKWTLPPLDKDKLPRFPVLNDVPDIRVPFVDDNYDDMHNGMRSLDYMIADVESVIHKQNGRAYADVITANEFQINTDEIYMFMKYELDYALRQYNDDNYAPGSALHYLMSLGIVSIYKGSHSDYDRMLRMSSAIQRKGLRPILNDPVALVEKLGGLEQEFKLGRLF